MADDIIRKHFVSVLGIDVGVSVEGTDARTVLLYRPDRLSEDFVAHAFRAFEDSHADVAAAIERVLVSFDGPLGRTRVRADVRALPSDPLSTPGADDGLSAPAPA